jgi:alpha-ketoglutarate-dependent 2,4-dichlorophenoxyacetate dioxygenase
MSLTFRKLHPVFVGEASPIELRTVHDGATLAKIRAGMDEFAVLVFRDQAFADAEQLAFAQRLDGQLHEGTGSRVIAKNRLGNEALADISNLDKDGEIMQADDRRRQYGRATMHRATPFDDAQYRRELRRVPTLDIAEPALVSAGS